MDFRVLLIQSIALLFWESQLEGSGLDSKDLVRRLINELPELENISGTDDDRNNLVALRDIALSLALGTTPLKQDVIKDRVKLSIKKDKELRDDAFELLSGKTNDLSAISDKIESIRGEIHRYIREKEFKKEMRLVN